MHELLTTAEMAEADRLAIAGGVAGIDLMERAGLAVAERVAARHPPGSRITVVAGPGNNGGDGFVAARILAECNFRVRVHLVGSRDRLKGDAARAAGRWSGPTEAAAPAAVMPADAIIDALFGAGLDRSAEGTALAMIEAMNKATDASVPVVAVDLPSGINGTSGTLMGQAVQARETVTFFRRKPGHLLLPGRRHCGPVSIADIGIPASVLGQIRPRIFVNCPALWAAHFPVPDIEAHKYSRGHAVVMSGGLASTGAARLCARAALRAGAGLVTIASPRDALAVNAAANLAVMVRPVDSAADLSAFLADKRRNAIVLGPGGGVGEPMRDLVLAALGGERSVVLDADALTSFAESPETLFSVIRGRTPATVLTPHAGEFARLFKNAAKSVDAPSKWERASNAARHSGAVVLLKGPDSVVAAPTGAISIADNAPPWLATAGSGDVLAGFVAGLLAQGMDAFHAASAAVSLHGEAGNESGPGLIAEDLPDVLPRVFRRLRAELFDRHRL